jgi:hypothetical protein
MKRWKERYDRYMFALGERWSIALTDWLRKKFNLPRRDA